MGKKEDAINFVKELIELISDCFPESYKEDMDDDPYYERGKGCYRKVISWKLPDGRRSKIILIDVSQEVIEDYSTDSGKKKVKASFKTEFEEWFETFDPEHNHPPGEEPIETFDYTRKFLKKYRSFALSNFSIGDLEILKETFEASRANLNSKSNKLYDKIQSLSAEADSYRQVGFSSQEIGIIENILSKSGKKEQSAKLLK